MERAGIRCYDGRTVTVGNPDFQYPVDYIGLTRGFSPGGHGGADLGWNANYGGRNQPLRTPGRVNRIRTVHDDGGWNGGYGNYITMESDGFLVLFGHCQLHSFKVKPGDILPRGVPVCRMNNSGNSTGDHLHYEIYLPGGTVSNDRVDPLPLTLVYPGQTVSPNTACKGEIRYLDAVPAPLPKGRVGTPKERDRTKEQIEVRVALNARSGAYLMDNIKGLFREGYYDVAGTADRRGEASNGYLWYRTHDGYYAAAVDGVVHYPEEESGANPGAKPAEDGREREREDWERIRRLAAESTEIAGRHL